MKANGTVFKYGDNVDTDVIIPARYLNSSDPAELASGGSPLWRTTMARLWRRLPSAMKLSCTQTLTWTHWKITAASGPFSVTAALTPTAALRNAGAGEPAPFARLSCFAFSSSLVDF